MLAVFLLQLELLQHVAPGVVCGELGDGDVDLDVGELIGALLLSEGGLAELGLLPAALDRLGGAAEEFGDALGAVEDDVVGGQPALRPLAAGLLVLRGVGDVAESACVALA